MVKVRRVAQMIHCRYSKGRLFGERRDKVSLVLDTKITGIMLIVDCLRVLFTGYKSIC